MEEPQLIGALPDLADLDFSDDDEALESCEETEESSSPVQEPLVKPSLQGDELQSLQRELKEVKSRLQLYERPKDLNSCVFEITAFHIVEVLT